MSFNDSNKKTLLNRNEEMNERKERFGDLVGFLGRRLKRGKFLQFDCSSMSVY